MFSALLLGFVNGARTFTAPALVAWAAALGRVGVAGSEVSFLSSSAPAVVLTVLALAELAADKHPAMPSRTRPGAVVARLVGALLVGAALASHVGASSLWIVATVLAALLGTYATRALRAILAKKLGSDRPAAFVEDAMVIAVCLSALGWWLPASAAVPETRDVHAAVNDSPVVAIATAFGPEFAALAPQIEQSRRVQHNGTTFVLGTLEGVRVVLFQTGISIVNASMTTQLAIDRLGVREIVVSGIAGAVDPALHIGDVCVPARWGKYDEMVYLRDDENARDALPPGIVLEYPPFEFMAPRPIPVANGTTVERRFWYPVDPQLLTFAEAALHRVQLRKCLADQSRCLPTTPRVHLGASAVSGSVFLDNARFREYLHDTFDAQVVEMETAAIAQVAYANGLPFIAVRSVSDLAGGQPKGNEMQIFMDLAADNAARVVRAFLAQRRSVETTSLDHPLP